MTEKMRNGDLWADFRKYFHAFVACDVEKCLRGNVEVGTIILTTIGIECLSGYLAGKEAGRETFVAFIERYMKRYSVFADDIYECVRNGLTHDYVTKENKRNGHRFVFTRDASEPHLMPAAHPNVFYLNRTMYATDFLNAQQNYFSDVENDQNLFTLALQRVTADKGFLSVRSESELLSGWNLSTTPTLASPSSWLATGTTNKPPEQR